MLTLIAELSVAIVWGPNIRLDGDKVIPPVVPFPLSSTPSLAIGESSVSARTPDKLPDEVGLAASDNAQLVPGLSAGQVPEEMKLTGMDVLPMSSEVEKSPELAIVSVCVVPTAPESTLPNEIAAGNKAAPPTMRLGGIRGLLASGVSTMKKVSVSFVGSDGTVTIKSPSTASHPMFRASTCCEVRFWVQSMLLMALGSQVRTPKPELANAKFVRPENVSTRLFGPVGI
jgi:hypothetical protein